MSCQLSCKWFSLAHRVGVMAHPATQQIQNVSVCPMMRCHYPAALSFSRFTAASGDLQNVERKNKDGSVSGAGFVSHCWWRWNESVQFAIGASYTRQYRYEAVRCHHRVSGYTTYLCSRRNTARHAPRLRHHRRRLQWDWWKSDWLYYFSILLDIFQEYFQFIREIINNLHCVVFVHIYHRNHFYDRFSVKVFNIFILQ